MKKLIPLLLLLISLNSVAKTISDEQTWVNLNTFIKINENWQGYLEYQPRFFDYQKYKGIALHRGAIGRNLGKGFTGWVGYGLIDYSTRRDSKFPASYQHEDRPFFQLLHTTSLGEFKILNRTRYELRMIRHTDETSERFRHMLRAQYKYVAIWDEYFWNTTGGGFDQNRVFIGGVYNFGENQQHMIESGYMNNYVNGAVNDRNAHVWMTTITGRF